MISTSYLNWKNDRTIFGWGLKCQKVNLKMANFSNLKLTIVQM